MSDLTQRTNAQTQAASRLIERWRSKAVFAKLQATYAAEIQALEDAIWQVRLSRMLNSATAAQLDLIGDIVGEPRNARDDSLYRLWIKIRIALLSSFGRGQDVIKCLKLATAATFHFRDLGRATFRIDFVDTFDQYVDSIARLVDRVRAGGVCAEIVWPTAVSGELRAKNVGDADQPGQGFAHGNASGPIGTTGGRASFVWRTGYPIGFALPVNPDVMPGGNGLLGFGSEGEGSLGEP